MANNSKKELLEWLALKPRTEGWGAVVAYNRNKCNGLLAQDYIHKFTTDSYLPPISEPVPTGDANWEHLHDWITTEPRLSFENSSKSAGGLVRMTMAVVGGSQISIDDAPGHNRAIAIKSLDALDYPKLIAEDVALTKTNGTVGKDTGEVVLDLGNPETAKGVWKLTFAHTDHEQCKGGAFFKKYYRNADPKKRLYHLGKIAYTDQQYLKPQSFILRTTTAPGAALSESTNYGDGSVELFVRMEGEAEGGIPPTDDWKHLNTEEDDCTVLLSNKMVMRKCIYPGLKAVVDALEEEVVFDEKIENGLIRGYVPQTNQSRSKDVLLEAFSLGGYQVDPYLPFTVPLMSWGNQDSGLSLTVVTSGDGVGKVRLSAILTHDTNTVVTISMFPENPLYSPFRYDTLIEADYAYQIDPATGVASFVLDKKTIDPRLFQPDDFNDNLKPLSYFFSPENIIKFYEIINGQFKPIIEKMIEPITTSTKSLDLFVLNSILFNDTTHVRLNSSNFPGDLAFFGRFDVRFAITDQDHLMGHGATHQFKVSPEFTGNVKWSVKVVPGSTGASGTINADTGVYSSPSLDDIDGTYTRVIVTATDTGSTFSSSTLVTVVVRDITVNPVVQICNASPETGAPVTRTLSAGTLGEGVLEWRVVKGDGSIPLRAGPDGKNVFTAAKQNKELEATFTVDEIEVKNLATLKTQRAYVVVNHFKQDLKIVVDKEHSSLPTGMAAFKVTGTRDRPVEAELEVIAGNGHVDSSGIYKSDPASPHRFALVKAVNVNDALQDGWILLTYSLIELPDKPVDDLENY
jgi:hypothetical protein